MMYITCEYCGETCEYRPDFGNDANSEEIEESEDKKEPVMI